MEKSSVSNKAWEEIIDGRFIACAENNCTFTTADGTKIQVQKGEQIIIGSGKSLLFSVGNERTIEVIRGNRYLCDPLNPLKRKNRGRICKLVDHESWCPSDGYVIWEDTGRMGKTKLADLTAIEE